MDVLDLHGVLFSGIAAGERFHERLHSGTGGREAGTRPLVSDRCLAGASADCGAVEHYRLEHRKVAAECRRSGHVLAAADAGRCGGAGLCEARTGDAFYRGEHDADMELGHSKFLVADCVCVRGAGIGVGDERRGAQSAAHAAARGVWGGGSDRADIHCRNICDSYIGAARPTWIRRAEYFTQLRSDRWRSRLVFWEYLLRCL